MNVQISNFTISNIKLIKSFKEHSPEKNLELAIEWLREYDPRNIRVESALDFIDYRDSYKYLYEQAAEEVVKAFPIPIISLKLLNAIADKHIVSFERAYVSRYEDLSDSFVRTLLTPSFEAHFDKILNNGIEKYTRFFYEKIDIVDLVSKLSPMTYCQVLQRTLSDYYFSMNKNYFRTVGFDSHFQGASHKIDFEKIANAPTEAISEIFKAFLLALQENKKSATPFNFDFLFCTMIALLMFNKHKHFKTLAKTDFNLLSQLVKTLCKMEQFDIYNQAVYNNKRLRFILPDLQERLSKVKKV